jgi:hypothetical protein
MAGRHESPDERRVPLVVGYAVSVENHLVAVFYHKRRFLGELIFFKGHSGASGKQQPSGNGGSANDNNSNNSFSHN